MGVREIWNSYKVLIVMGTSLGLIHWGWYTVKSNPLLRKDKDNYTPETGIVAFVAPLPTPSKTK